MNTWVDTGEAFGQECTEETDFIRTFDHAFGASTVSFVHYVAQKYDSPGVFIVLREAEMFNLAAGSDAVRFTEYVEGRIFASHDEALVFAAKTAADVTPDKFDWENLPSVSY